MRVIGITGGVGSGKSYVAHHLQELLGTELLIADELGHIVMEPEKPAYRQIVDTFGNKILDREAKIDREVLAKIIFEDSTARESLNCIIHPAVMQYIKQYIKDRRDDEGLILLETAIMYETGCDKLCDEVWLVAVPCEERIRRLQNDRGYSREKTEAIMRSQMPEEKVRKRATRIIDNTGDITALEEQLQLLASSHLNTETFS